jgi:hypothetical protein
MNNTVRLVVRVAAILLAARGGVDGQSPAPQGSSNSTVTSSAPALSFQSSLAALQNTNRTLLGQQFTLLSSGATSAQLTAWQQQNSASFAAQQNQVQSLAAQTVPALLPTITDLAVPTDASPELVALLTTKANLLNEDILKNNQLQTAGSVTATAAQPLSATAVAALQTLSQQTQAVAAQSAHVAVPVPGATSLPPSAPPKLKAFLLARDQLMREELQLYNQYVNSDPSARDAALQQWHQTNASRFLQLRQLAQALSPNPN